MHYVLGVDNYSSMSDIRKTYTLPHFLHICHDLFQFQQSRAHSSVCLHVRYIGIVHIIHTMSNQCGIQSLEYIRYIISNIVNLHTEASILVNTGDLKMLSISVGFRGEMEVKHQ